MTLIISLMIWTIIIMIMIMMMITIVIITISFLQSHLELHNIAAYTNNTNTARAVLLWRNTLDRSREFRLLTPKVPVGGVHRYILSLGEAVLKPTFVAMPKNEHGKLEDAAARCIPSS